MATTDESASDFSTRVTQQLVGGIAGMGVAIGMETGLFEMMIAMGESKKTSQEIADLANMKERYVREWLGCMAAANIVNFDPTEGTFWLPSHRSNIMDLKALAMTAPVLQGGFFQVADCFRKDGPRGVAYGKYPKFDELMAMTQGVFFQDHLIQEFIPSMPHLHQQLQNGIVVLDIGCCEGVSTTTMAKEFPKSHFHGLDLSQPALATARDTASAMGLSNVEFVHADISLMPPDWTDKFDYLFMNFVLHDLAYTAKALQDMYRVLKPGGTLSVVETTAHGKLKDNLAVPDRDSVVVDYMYSLMNCMPTSLYHEGGAGLGSMWGRENVRVALEEAEFQVISMTDVPSESGLHFMCQKATNA
ncbi:uncharacterized protein LOC117296022 [Asterias rubens]|uniref:uncharacterized protein LOC117296022 n=1 Tax=Asterias rubens TaxID=7604 RepID=UPI0014558A3D|nr:uncharacterized protein LOC117296022 [Asterias rubens]